MMKMKPAVKKETLRMTVGVAILTALMLAVFLIIGRFDMTVLWGGLLGGAFAALNFFLMAMGVQVAAEKMNGVQLPPEPEIDEDGEEPAEPEPVDPEVLGKAKEGERAAKRVVQKSYYGRMALTVCMAVLAMKAPMFNPIAALIPLLFPRMVVMVLPLLDKFQKGA